MRQRYAEKCRLLGSHRRGDDSVAGVTPAITSPHPIPTPIPRQMWLWSIRRHRVAGELWQVRRSSARAAYIATPLMGAIVQMYGQTTPAEDWVGCRDPIVVWFNVVIAGTRADEMWLGRGEVTWHPCSFTRLSSAEINTTTTHLSVNLIITPTSRSNPPPSESTTKYVMCVYYKYTLFSSSLD